MTPVPVMMANDVPPESGSVIDVMSLTSRRYPVGLTQAVGRRLASAPGMHRANQSLLKEPVGLMSSCPAP